MIAENMVVGESYNFHDQKERLMYIGNNPSCNGYWYQFEKISKPGEVWCELQGSDLNLIEMTPKTDILKVYKKPNDDVVLIELNGVEINKNNVVVHVPPPVMELDEDIAKVWNLEQPEQGYYLELRLEQVEVVLVDV